MNAKRRAAPPSNAVPAAHLSTKSFVEVENLFEDRAVAERYLPRSSTRTYPPDRGYGDGLLKMYRDRAAQLISHQGDQRWRNREQKLSRLMEIADSVFFQMFRVYAIARTRYHQQTHADGSGAGTPGAPPNANDAEDDDNNNDDADEDDSDDNSDEPEDSDGDDEADDGPAEDGERAAEDEVRVAFSRASTRDIGRLLRRARFLFAETNTRRVGRGDALNVYGSKTPSQRAHQIVTVLMLHRHFHEKMLRFKSAVEDPMVMSMLKTELTGEEATELFLICETMYELIERQKIVANAYARSLLMFSECVDFEKCVHSLYLTKLQLLNELRHTYNGNELNKDWLLINEMLTVREHDVIAYERMLNYAHSLMRPPYTIRAMSAFAYMIDVRNHYINQLVINYLHDSYKSFFDGVQGQGVTWLAWLINRALGLTCSVVDLAACYRSGETAARRPAGASYLVYPPHDDADSPAVQRLWQAVLVHCACIMPSALITTVYRHMAKRETRWEIRITDILRYVDWLCVDDPTYTCYTQKQIQRYLTFDESALAAQFSTLYDHECILFSLFIRNRFSPSEKVEELRAFVGRSVNVQVDLRDRPFRYGYTAADQSSPRRSAYAYRAEQYHGGGLPGADDEMAGAVDADARTAAERPHRPFTYDPRVCHTFPHINQNYYNFVRHFYDLEVYHDTLRYGLNLICLFLEEVLAARQSPEYCDSSDDTISANIEREGRRIAGGASGGAAAAAAAARHIAATAAGDSAAGSGGKAEPLPAEVLSCLQYTMNFLNANCWLYDGCFLHLTNANAYFAVEKKKFMERLKSYRHRFRRVHESLGAELVNIDEMIASVYRFSSSLLGRTASKMAKVIGNTLSMTGHSSINQSFLRVNHGLSRVMMMNVHVNMYELVAPCVLYLLSMDTRNFGTDDGDQFSFGVNQNAAEFVLQAWQCVPEYVRTLVSVDSFATLLYAPLVREKRHETIFTGLDLAIGGGAGGGGGGGGEAAAMQHSKEAAATARPAEDDDTVATTALGPSPPKKRKKRRALGGCGAATADTWDSLTGIASHACRGKGPDAHTAASPVTATAAAAAAMPNLPPPSNANDKYVPYTIDREEFFQLANHLNLEWAHQTYSRLKSFKYFLAAMMQILNQYGDRLFLYENGLRLSATVLLQRIRSESERRHKRQAGLFADYVACDEAEDCDDALTRSTPPAEHADAAAAAAAVAPHPRAEYSVDQRRRPPAPELTRFSLNQLLDVNTSATSLTQFFSGMIKQSLTNDDALTRFKNYFQRAPTDETRVLLTSASDSAGAAASASSSATSAKQWSSCLDPAYRQRNEGVRPLHTELLLMDNLTDLLFQLFHDPGFFDWVVGTVSRGELYTNNLLDFSDKLFVGFFASYLYVLRSIDNYVAMQKSMGRGGGGGGGDGNGSGTTDGKSSFNTLSQYFWRNGTEELALLRRLFVSRQVSSPNLLNTATGLRKFIDVRHERNQVPVLRPSLTASKRDAICYFIMCVYTFSDCNLAYALFMFRLIMSIKFPGSWTKTITILQGSSNSGKSEFVELVRNFFNSTNGVVNPNVWRSSTTNDIGTNLFPLMENLVCQSDEVDCINNTLLKTVVSKTAKQCRSFGSQESQQLHNLSKVFMSVNKQPHVDDPDEGVLTRMQVILPVFHKYLPRIRPETDTTKKQEMASFSPSHQFSFGVYPIGAHALNYTVGLFYCYENYGPYVVSKNVAAFKAADAIHHQRLANFLLGRASTRFSSDTVPSLPNSQELQRYAVFVACHTNINQTPAEFLTHQDNPMYYLTNNPIQTVDGHDTKVYVDLANQPMIAALFRIDSHANMDPMVKFDALYKVRPTAKPIDWTRIERVLRDHLIEFYCTEERGDSYSVASTGGTMGAGLSVGGDATDAAASAGVAPSQPRTTLSRRINFKAFYDRFKNRFAHLQHRDPQTRQVVPNKWCLVIKRLNE